MNANRKLSFLESDAMNSPEKCQHFVASYCDDCGKCYSCCECKHREPAAPPEGATAKEVIATAKEVMPNEGLNRNVDSPRPNNSAVVGAAHPTKHAVASPAMSARDCAKHIVATYDLLDPSRRSRDYAQIVDAATARITAYVAALTAENARLTKRNRELADRGDDALVKVARLREHIRDWETIRGPSLTQYWESLQIWKKEGRTHAEGALVKRDYELIKRMIAVRAALESTTPQEEK